MTESSKDQTGQDRAVGVPGEDVGSQTRQVRSPDGDIETPLERELDRERQTDHHPSDAKSLDEQQALPSDDPGHDDARQPSGREIPSGMGGAGGGDLDDLGSTTDRRERRGY